MLMLSCILNGEEIPLQRATPEGKMIDATVCSEGLESTQNAGGCTHIPLQHKPRTVQTLEPELSLGQTACCPFFNEKEAAMSNIKSLGSSSPPAWVSLCCAPSLNNDLYAVYHF